MSEKYLCFNALSDAYGGKYPWPEDREFYEPFKNLVITILSQNTSDVNCIRAYRALKKRFEISSQALARAGENEIAEAIKAGGLYRIKAKRLKEISRIIMDKFGGDLGKIIGSQNSKAELLKLPGIGNKTADVILAFSAGKDVIPIDTHLSRIAKRLGVVAKNASYTKIQKAFERIIPTQHRARGHVLFIMLGKDYCRARNPRCSECPVASFCGKKFTRAR